MYLKLLLCCADFGFPVDIFLSPSLNLLPTLSRRLLIYLTWPPIYPDPQVSQLQLILTMTQVLLDLQQEGDIIDGVTEFNITPVYLSRQRD